MIKKIIARRWRQIYGRPLIMLMKIRGRALFCSEQVQMDPWYLKAAKEQTVVSAAIALSPGEFFLPLFSIENTISGIQKPLLITASRTEYPYVEQIMSNVEEEYKTIFVPENSEGERGSAALLPDNPSYTEYWLAILLFFKDLQ